MKQIDRIINENINKFLIESASQNLYHYINGIHLITLLKNNRLTTSDPEKYTKDIFHDTYIDGENMRFISFTRNKNGKEGYPVLKYGGFGDGEDHFICRLDIDGDYLNTHNLKRHDKRFKKGYENVKTKIKPIDWAYYDIARGGDVMAMANETQGIFAHNGKEWQMKSYDMDYYYPLQDDATDMYNHPMSQAEDRLTSTSKYIPNANKYIKCIDIFVTEEIDNDDYKILYKINSLSQNLGIEVNFYDNFEYFSRQMLDMAFNIDGVQRMLWN